MSVIPHNKPFLGDEEAQAAASVIKSNWIISGDEVNQFENSLKSYLGKKHALALNSGHAGLHLALLALGVKENNEIILPSYITPDLLNVIYYCKAVPVVVDSEENGFNIDVRKVKDKCTERTKAMIIPHTFGFPADVESLKELKIPIIEDCAQSLGTMHHDKPLGTLGDITVFSFYASKIITTGQGGMVLTDNDEYLETMRDLISYNMPISYRVRYNYPMTDIAASLGNAQFAKLPAILETRKNISNLYREVLKNKQVKYYPNEDQPDVNHFRFLIQLNNQEELLRVKEEFTKREITTIIPYPANEVGHRILNLDSNEFPNTEKIISTVLSLPIYTGLTVEETDRITAALNEIL